MLVGLAHCNCYPLITYNDKRLHMFSFLLRRKGTTAYEKSIKKRLTDRQICPKIADFEPRKTGTRPKAHHRHSLKMDIDTTVQVPSTLN